MILQLLRCYCPASGLASAETCDVFRAPSQAPSSLAPAPTTPGAASLPKMAVHKSNLATAALAAHPFRPLYLSGVQPAHSGSPV